MSLNPDLHHTSPQQVFYDYITIDLDEHIELFSSFSPFRFLLDTSPWAYRHGLPKVSALLRPAGTPPLSGVVRQPGSRPAAVFYPFGHPTSYAYAQDVRRRWRCNRRSSGPLEISHNQQVFARNLPSPLHL
jgi:hypothetical protein